MRAPRPRNDIIDGKRTNRWVQRFAAYRSSVSNASVEEWLKQFKGQRDLAARLLDVVEFFSGERISAAFRSALKSLPGWHSNPAQRTGNWRFAAMSTSAGESGDSMLHMFRVANGLDSKQHKDLFVHPSSILMEGLGSNDTLVLVDDFTGSGKQVCDAWKESFAELVVGIGRVFLIVVAASRTASEAINKETNISLVPHHWLNDSDNFFSTQCSHFTKAEKDAMHGFCALADPKNPRGFGDCGFVVVFQHRCPNNSIAVLHASTSKWEPIFPRHY